MVEGYVVLTRFHCFLDLGMTNKRRLEEKLRERERERELGLGSVGVSLRDLFIIYIEIRHKPT